MWNTKRTGSFCRYSGRGGRNSWGVLVLLIALDLRWDGTGYNDFYRRYAPQLFYTVLLILNFYHPDLPVYLIRALHTRHFLIPAQYATSIDTEVRSRVLVSV